MSVGFDLLIAEYEWSFVYFYRHSPCGLAGRVCLTGFSMLQKRSKDGIVQYNSGLRIVHWVSQCCKPEETISVYFEGELNERFKESFAFPTENNAAAI